MVLVLEVVIRTHKEFDMVEGLELKSIIVIKEWDDE